MVEITELMMADLGVTPKYVQTPFAQLFAGLAAGKFDMVGIAATILPSRALQGTFAGVPVFYESNVVLVKKTVEGARSDGPCRRRSSPFCREARSRRAGR